MNLGWALLFPRGRNRILDFMKSPHTMDRRRFLRLTGLSVLGAAMTGLVPEESLASTRTLSLKNIHTGESLSKVFKTSRGYDSAALSSIDKLLRDHRTGDVHPIDPRLLDFLDAIATRLNTTADFQVISGFRSAKTNNTLRNKGRQVARKSYHLVGQAVDIRIPGVALNQLHRAALDLKLGGVGLYRGQDFIHVDTGPVRSW